MRHLRLIHMNAEALIGMKETQLATVSQGQQTSNACS